MKRLLVVWLLFVCIVLCAPKVKQTISKKKNKTPRNILREKCEKYKLSFDIMSAVVHAESYWVRTKIEWSRHIDKFSIVSIKAISFGYMQLSIATAKMYCRHTGAKKPRGISYKKWLFKKRVNFEIGCWSIARHKRLLGGNIKKALSAHNLGYSGFKKWLRRNPRRTYYYFYVRRVEKRLGRKL